MTNHSSTPQTPDTRGASPSASALQSNTARLVSWLPWMALAVVSFVLLYFLSLGPAVWVTNRFEADSAMPYLETLYAPVIWLHENTPLEGPIEWYVDLFEE